MRLLNGYDLDGTFNGQVEELKAIVRLIPTWACTIIVTTLAFQILFVSAGETLTMDRRIGSFIVPPQSFAVGFCLLIMCVLVTYDLVIVPLMRHYTHNPRGISILQRIGIGIFLSIVAAVASAIIERQRRKVRISKGKKKKRLNFTLSSSIIMIRFISVSDGSLIMYQTPTGGQIGYIYAYNQLGGLLRVLKMPRTDGSLILIFSNTQDWRFFETEIV
jgi:hypothetical protein